MRAGEVLERGRQIVVGVRGIARTGREVEDDLGAVGGFFLFDGGEGADHKVGDIGEDGGAARGDLVVGEEEVEVGEGAVDLPGGEEVVVLAEEVVRAATVVAVGMDGVMGGAEAGARVLGGMRAAAAGRAAVKAAGIVG